MCGQKGSRKAGVAVYTRNGSTGSYFDAANFDAANWSPAGVPGRGDTALVGAGNVTFPRFGNEAFTGGETFLLSGSAIFSLSLSPFAVLGGDTFVLPADVRAPPRPSWSTTAAT